MGTATPDEVMRALLARHGFSFARPDVGLAWEAFKAFADEPIRGFPRYCVGYECVHCADRDDVLWLNFARRSDPDLVGADADLTARDGGCELSRVVPQELRGVRESLWWWPQHGPLAEWVLQVEQSRGFRTCLTLDGWRWEGFAD